MKKLVKCLILAVCVLLFCASCHDCAVCGKSKLFTTKKTVLGRDVYICKDCKEAPEKALNEIKDGVQTAADEIKGLFK